MYLQFLDFGRTTIYGIFHVIKITNNNKRGQNDEETISNDNSAGADGWCGVR